MWVFFFLILNLLRVPDCCNLVITEDCFTMNQACVLALIDSLLAFYDGS